MKREVELCDICGKTSAKIASAHNTYCGEEIGVIIDCGDKKPYDCNQYAISKAKLLLRKKDNETYSIGYIEEVSE